MIEKLLRTKPAAIMLHRREQSIGLNNVTKDSLMWFQCMS